MWTPCVCNEAFTAMEGRVSAARVLSELLPSCPDVRCVRNKAASHELRCRPGGNITDTVALGLCAEAAEHLADPRKIATSTTATDVGNHLATCAFRNTTCTTRRVPPEKSRCVASNAKKSSLLTPELLRTKKEGSRTTTRCRRKLQMRRSQDY